MTVADPCSFDHYLCLGMQTVRRGTAVLHRLDFRRCAENVSKYRHKAVLLRSVCRENDQYHLSAPMLRMHGV